MLLERCHLWWWEKARIGGWISCRDCSLQEDPDWCPGQQTYKFGGRDVHDEEAEWKTGGKIWMRCHPLYLEHLLCQGKKRECLWGPSDGNISKNLVSDRCESNDATDNSEDASSPTVIDETTSQSNPTKGIRSKPIQAKIRGGLGGSTKAFIILVGLVVPTIILYALQGAYARIKESKESMKYSI